MSELYSGTLVGKQKPHLPSGDELKRLYETYYNFGVKKGTIYAILCAKFFSSGLRSMETSISMK
jgi:hypothetical protein